MRAVTAGDRRPYVPVTIWWGKSSSPTHVLALVDTGAEITLLQGNPSNHKGEVIYVEGLGGQTTPAVRTRVKLAIGKGPGFWANVLVSDLPENILGIDLLLGQSVKTEWGTFSFGTQHKPYLMRAVKAVVRGHAKWKPVYIPPPERPVCLKQYKLPGGHSEISETIQELLRVGILRPAFSPFNAPVFPVKKSDGSWRMTVDYRGLNKVAPPLAAAVPDMISIVERIAKEAGEYHAVIDLANAFFSIPIDSESQDQFAFSWDGRQYTFQVLPQGYQHSPTICHGLIARDLGMLNLKVATFHYIDDIMISGTKEDVSVALPLLIQHLEDRGWAVNKDKIQGPATEVKFLGMMWTGPTRKIPETVVQTIQGLLPPKTKKEA